MRELGVVLAGIEEGYCLENAVPFSPEAVLADYWIEYRLLPLVHPR